MLNVFVDFLGCKLNQAEAEEISFELLRRGYGIAPSLKEADVYLLNSCAVTHTAERKTRGKLARARRQNPLITRILMGCCGEKDGQGYIEKGLAEYVYGTQDRYDFYGVLPEIRSTMDNSLNSFYDVCSQVLGRHRSFVQIQQGCDNFCTYCIVPHLRTCVMSTPMEDVLATVNDRVERGYGEITLTGTEIGTYYYAGYNLVDLLKDILQKSDVKRLRLSSLQPREITDELLDLFKKEDRLAPHFHISLQSASPRILRDMKRPYTIEEYQAALDRVWKALPSAAITTDVIVGFPGEEEMDFEKTLEFCRSTPFARIHVFPYSSREGTVAATMPMQISEKLKNYRAQAMLEVAAQSMRGFLQKRIGQQTQVYVEDKRSGFYEGYTADYVRVLFTSNENLSGCMVEVYLQNINKDGQSVNATII